MREEIIVEYSETNPRGPGWYWWVQGFENDKPGPFETSVKANWDIALLGQEANYPDF